MWKRIKLIAEWIFDQFILPLIVTNRPNDNAKKDEEK